MTKKQLFTLITSVVIIIIVLVGILLYSIYAARSGVDRNIVLSVAAIGLGVICIAAAELYRRIIKKRTGK